MKSMYERIYYILKQTKYFLLRCFMRLLWIAPIDEKKIVLSNFNGKGFGDNPKYIALALHKK